MQRLAFLALALLALGGRPAAAADRISVQPIEGTSGAELRQQIARLLRGRGFRVVTSVARVEGTGQYLTLAKDHRLAAFVTGDLEEHRARHTITFLIWNGANGSVLGRWSATAAPKRLPRAVARGFWKHLGPAFDDASAPPSEELAPAPTLRIDASLD
jgi:hypothetical protein